MRKTTILLLSVLTIWLVMPLIQLVRMTVGPTPSKITLEIFIVLGAISLLLGLIDFNKRRCSWAYFISGTLFMGFTALSGGMASIAGIAGLILLVCSTGLKFPAGLMLLMMLFNTGGLWRPADNNYTRMPEQNYKRQENTFLFMLKQVANFVLPQIDAKTYGKTFERAQRIEFSGGSVMKVSTGTDFKIREISTHSYGSTYKIESSKPVSFGMGIWQVKFTHASLEISNNYQAKVLGGDFRGNKWLENYLLKNTFDLHF